MSSSNLHLLATGTPVSDEDVSREKMSKKIPPEDHAPFYLSGTSVDMPDDGLDVDSFQVRIFIFTHAFYLTVKLCFVNFLFKIISKPFYN